MKFLLSEIDVGVARLSLLPLESPTCEMNWPSWCEWPRFSPSAASRDEEYSLTTTTPATAATGSSSLCGQRGAYECEVQTVSGGIPPAIAYGMEGLS